MLRRLLVGVCTAVALMGCAANQPPPSATAVPWDPNLLTVSRPNAADRWAADVARRNYVSQYMNLICGSDGDWAKINEAWMKEERYVWTDILWKFEPIPNAPRSSNIDFGQIIGSLLGGAIKLAPLLLVQPQKTALPPGVPPC